jgi:hypothetical protein
MVITSYPIINRYKCECTELLLFQYIKRFVEGAYACGENQKGKMFVSRQAKTEVITVYCSDVMHVPRHEVVGFEGLTAVAGKGKV